MLTVGEVRQVSKYIVNSEALCEAISATAGTELTPLKTKTARSGTQFSPLMPAQPL